MQEARTIRASVLGEDHWVTGYSTAWLGTVYIISRTRLALEEAFRQAMLNRKRRLGENHPNYATALDNLANCYSRRGDYAKAVTLSRQSVAIRKAAFGEKDLTYALGVHNLAHLYMEMRNYARPKPASGKRSTLRKRCRARRAAATRKVSTGLPRCTFKCMTTPRGKRLSTSGPHQKRGPGRTPS